MPPGAHVSAVTTARLPASVEAASSRSCTAAEAASGSGSASLLALKPWLSALKESRRWMACRAARVAFRFWAISTPELLPCNQTRLVGCCCGTKCDVWRLCTRRRSLIASLWDLLFDGLELEISNWVGLHCGS